MPMDIIRKSHAAASPSDDPLEFVMSDETVDRLGDVIHAKGWSLDNFRRNPVALFGHDSKAFIGRWSNVRVEGNRLLGRLELLEKGTSERIDELHAAIKAGVLRAVSVGFRALESPQQRDTKDPRGGVTFTKSELMECSLVSIPANPNALQVAKSLHLSSETMASIFGESVDRSWPQFHGASAEPKPSREGKHMSNSIRLDAAEQQFNAARDALTSHLDTLDDGFDEAKAAETEKLNADVAKMKRFYEALKSSETLLGQQSQPTGVLPARLPVAPQQQRLWAQPKDKIDALDYVGKALTVRLLAHLHRKMPDEMLQTIQEYRGREDIRVACDVVDMYSKAASAPATTTTSGWASHLVESINVDFMPTLMAAAVYPSLSRLGLRLDFGRAGQINIPSRVSTPTIAGSFVAEGSPIPVRQGAFTSTPLTPKKLAVISTFTREIAMHSVPAIEGLIRDAIQEDTSVALDMILLDATAATSVRPAGLRYNIAVTTATAGGGYAALVGDIKALIGALITATNGNMRQLVWIMNPVQAAAIALTSSDATDMPFKAEIAQNRLLGYPVIISPTVTAGMLILLDAADFVSVTGDGPMFDVSDTATLHMEDTTPLAIGTVGSPNTVAAPVRSLWQTDTVGIRMIQPMNWTLRRASLAWTQSVTW
jgi:HK97 family phage prohead protease